MLELPVVSLDDYLRDPTSDSGRKAAQATAEALILTGAVVVRDSRAPKQANDRFLDLFEDYFAQDREELEKDLRPEVGYQVGVTLENTERPKCSSDEECLSVIAMLEETQRPVDLSGHGADPKCRWFHRMSETPPYPSAFPVCSAPNVTPRAFPDWEVRVNEWGGFMKQAVEGVTRMLAVGLGLDEFAFLSVGKFGSHLLAPTATDLEKYGKLNTIFAGFHTDLNFLTIHGQSRYPGLHIWARNSGKRISVRIPPECLLVQAGKQLEWATGGLIKAGFHEVVCTEATLQAMERRKREFPDRPLNRISSTFFWHLSPDHLLQPDPILSKMAEDRFGPQKAYGAMLVGEQVQRELGLIALMPSN
ncbi:hypothetical protein TREMEDRAFT_67719 [Tremella mesenterica DSM 1558]|uniref:uncharacterized protein n=1 Tax=Tremella mesenterica (strain ATCC 24925 / CBS 8224 / DSM 1558 / NBRC 9311 / NRRL Y-6157 / RJB 2259-6 / UBC 559-6) TaxID=578456 RepID=UPI0003F49F5F|nr:uncharacterized protein TREMEDRAFT_67719 [Tremella mesenterica DSM 1558]EIW71350.1 hypothetical protein TREMEDRAFT_67719 [Tremella mesenterica DSM 1558]